MGLLTSPELNSFPLPRIERRRFFFFSLRVAARRRQRSGDNPIELGGEEGYNIHAEKEAIVIHHGCRGAYATSIAGLPLSAVTKSKVIWARFKCKLQKLLLMAVIGETSQKEGVEERDDNLTFYVVK
ncbi:hypothetical protein OUZ56_000496 [Daphnia magna]|uniref:Uncharacterized protein n=1 Tax=Daphnia magna TaxID=35525 RepID=A0ABQ9ZZV4_9CRUS|nr:hypothetical protein OUZ56_000496 [Daphnia magna]